MAKMAIFGLGGLRYPLRAIFGSKMTQKGHFWKFLGYFGSYLAIFGRIWAKFGGISPNTAYFGQKSLKRALFGLFLAIFGQNDQI